MNKSEKVGLFLMIWFSPAIWNASTTSIRFFAAIVVIVGMTIFWSSKE